ncbi:sulfatase-like hydrolase/transferase [Dyadobacter tibetensis]|uniref:sulfatase-like hydrolase/transferase n=1 Tax=Dyadobacter tibetensis TaxID=1211851 RepID=UPI001E34F1DA|nr:sulfatase-like hydrolase/transferase [Dyadobacter tibetensis]
MKTKFLMFNFPKPRLSTGISKSVILSILGLFLLSIPGYTQKKRPNILFILADDQSPYDLKVYDKTSALITPNLDKLAAEGMVFDAAYHMGSWIGAVCTASRTMLMTGRSVWKLPHNANPNHKDQELIPAHLEDQSMAALFNKAGYATMRTCKSGNSYKEANQKFTVNKETVSRAGNDENGSAWHAAQVLDYLTDREANKDEAPFLIYFGFSHPHDPRNGKEGLLEKYGAVNHNDQNSLPQINSKQPALPSNYLAAHPFFHGHPQLRDEEMVSGVWKNRDEGTIRNELGREFACSENIDDQIGKVLSKLEEMGELDNTYIFYTADHGIAIGRHGLMGKQNLYEHTWRVPFIVKGPGIKAGKRAEGNIYLMDVLPTICDLAGIDLPNTIDAKSFKPVLFDQKKTIREVMYGVYSGGTKPGMRAVRQGDWKLIKYDTMDGTIRETQLFNLKENPHEYLSEHRRTDPMENNLASNPKYATKLKEMEGLLQAQMKEYKDPYQLWDQK